MMVKLVQFTLLLLLLSVPTTTHTSRFGDLITFYRLIDYKTVVALSTVGNQTFES